MTTLQSELTLDLIPSARHGRSSEGAFLRGPDGAILFAYSCYHSGCSGDDDACDIAMRVSRDEGATWGEECIIARAADFGVSNVMSVSQLRQRDGRFGFYFLIKENDGTSTVGRTLSEDGVHFTPMRCDCRIPKAYYVINNDRLERLADGTLAAPASTVPIWMDDAGQKHYDFNFTTVVLVSRDDGASFTLAPPRLTLNDRASGRCASGMMEPGLLQKRNGTLWLWARTVLGYQYESFSPDGMQTFTPPVPSPFTSPDSPMEVLRGRDGTLYLAYNPIPRYNGRDCTASWGRTPLALRISRDDGCSWSDLFLLEDDPQRGYCYPALFETDDHALLAAFCRGGPRDGNCLCRLGIRKIPLDQLENVPSPAL